MVLKDQHVAVSEVSGLKLSLIPRPEEEEEKEGVVTENDVSKV